MDKNLELIENNFRDKLPTSWTHSGPQPKLPTNWSSTPWGVVFGHNIPHGKAALLSEQEQYGSSGQEIQSGQEDEYFTDLEKKNIFYPRGKIHWYGDGGFKVSFYLTYAFPGLDARKISEDAAWKVVQKLESKGFGPGEVTSYNKKMNLGVFLGPESLNKSKFEPSVVQTPEEDRRLMRLEMFSKLKISKIKEALRFVKTSDWAEVAAKAKRLKDSGHVQVANNTKDHVQGGVQGDNGVYEVNITKNPQNPRKIMTWSCDCPWGKYAWQRTRQWKKFEGRVCSHVLALYWTSLTIPEQDPQQEISIPEQPITQPTTLPNNWETVRATKPSLPQVPQGVQQSLPGLVPISSILKNKWRIS